MNNLRLDLSEFNSSLIEMLEIMKNQNDFVSKIINPQRNFVAEKSFEGDNEEMVDLTKLKLNIQALKEAVQTAKKNKKKS